LTTAAVSVVYDLPGRTERRKERETHLPLIEGPLIYRPEQKPGKAVLVVGAKGTFVLRPDSKLSLGDRWRGAQKYFVVDVSRKSSELRFLTPSNKSVLEFEVQATLYCRVANPAQAFFENLTDPGEAMHATVKKLVSNIANEVDITEAIKLKSRLEAYFRDHRVTNATQGAADDEASAELLDIDLKVFPAESAREYVGNIEREELTIRSSQALHRVQDSQRKAMNEVFWSHEELLKQWIVTKDDSYREALRFRLEQDAASNQLKLALLKQAQDSGALDERELHRLAEPLVQELIDQTRRAAQRSSPGPSSGGEALPKPAPGDDGS
jgi:hypothetical protein